MRRPTPCVGICSTTYGDLVCRGCKRFAHEIVQWNGYTEAQREEIRQRLRSLSQGALQRYLSVVDPQQLKKYLALQAPDANGLGSDKPDLLRAYAALRAEPELDASELGLELHMGFANQGLTGRQALITAVEAEFYARAEAQYEHDFKVPVR